MNFNAFKKTPEELTTGFRSVKTATLREGRDLIEGEEKNVTVFFIARDIIDEKSFLGSAYFYKQGMPYRKAVARFDLTGWGIPESQFRRDFEGKVIKLGKQVTFPQLGSAVPEINLDQAGIVYTVDMIYTETSWNNRLALLRRDTEEPPEY
jgi:hypothetical protein